MGPTVVLFLKNSKTLLNDFLINGKKSNGLNPFDRGLAFGDGIFRTFKVHNGTPIFWDYHYEKLTHDALALKIDIPSSTILQNQIKKLFQKKGLYVGKFIITRGLSDRGYQIPNKAISPNCILLKSRFKKIDKSFYMRGVHVEVSQMIPSSNLHLGSIKHLNRLENVLSREQLSKDAFDAVMLDNKKNIIECCSHNVFFRFENKIIMPAMNEAGVSGVSQWVIKDFAQSNGYKVEHESISLKKANKADEFFIANSVNGVIPVRSFNQKYWKDFKFVQELKHSITF